MIKKYVTRHNEMSPQFAQVVLLNNQVLRIENKDV